MKRYDLAHCSLSLLHSHLPPKAILRNLLLTVFRLYSLLVPPSYIEKFQACLKVFWLLNNEFHIPNLLTAEYR